MLTPQLILKSGKITHIDTGVYTYSTNSSNLHSRNSYAIRIDDVSARFLSDVHFSFSKGDKFTAAGVLKNGVLHIHAFKNGTTNAIGGTWETYKVTTGWAVVIIGILTALFLIGIPILLWGINYLSNALAGEKAKAMVMIEAGA